MEKKKYRILLVDDDQFLLDIYALKFKEDGHEVEVVLGAPEALELMRAEPVYDIVVFDMVMPTMDGLTLLKAMKKEGLLPQAAKIVLSNQGQPDDIEKAKEEGVDGYIIKAETIPSEVVEEIISIANQKQTS